MTVSSVHQLAVLGLGTLAGLAAGVLLTFFSVLRGELKLAAAGTAVTDLLFWLAVGTLLLWLGLRFDDGRVRGFQFVAVACGFSLHALCLARVTRAVSRFVLCTAAFVLLPLRLLLKAVLKGLNRILRKVSAIKTKFQKNLDRFFAARKTRKKIRKKYKKML